MSSLISLQPSNYNFDVYLKEINSGNIQIPEFQRDFIWDLENVLNLLRSIKQNYPIGSFLFWKPETQFKVSKQIGPYFIKDENIPEFETKTCKYVLDGYQRMSTLFGALTNPKNIHNFYKNEKLYNSTFNIYYNLHEEEFENYGGRVKERESFVVPVYILLDYEGFLTISEKIQSDFSPDVSKLYTSRLKKIVTTFERYQMPVIEIAGGSLQEAIDIFTLLNKEGKPITPDWILSAKTYSSDFRLADKIDETLIKLEKYNFTDKRPKELAVRELIFRSIQSSFGDLYLDNKKTDIITLSKKPTFADQIDLTIKSIEKASKFLFEELLVVDNKLLPANMQFIFLVEFFNKINNPSNEQIEKLKKWFWVTSYSNYFTIYSPSVRKEAFKYFQNSILERDVDYIYSEKPFASVIPELPKKINFQGVRSKTHILFLLNSSNDFNPIDVNYIEGYTMKRLFSEVDNDLLELYGESCNLIVCLDKTTENLFINNSKKVKDFSFLLSLENLGKYSEFFISDEMRIEFEKGNIHNVLYLRKKLIDSMESDFVNSFGKEYIEYYDDDSSFDFF